MKKKKNIYIYIYIYIFLICDFELRSPSASPFLFVSHQCMLSFIRPNLVSVMYMVLRQSIRISMVTAFFVYLNGILAFQILIIPRLLHPHQITTRQAREDQKLVLKSRQLSKWTNAIKVSFFLNARLLDVDVFGCSIAIYIFFLFVQFIERVVYCGDLHQSSLVYCQYQT